MEAEFRRKVRENEACLAQQLRAELPEDARQALLDRERLQLELTQLQESIGSGGFKGFRVLGSARPGEAASGADAAPGEHRLSWAGLFGGRAF